MGCTVAVAPVQLHATFAMPLASASVICSGTMPVTVEPSAGAAIAPVGGVLSAITWIVCTTVMWPVPSVTTLQTL